MYSFIIGTDFLDDLQDELDDDSIGVDSVSEDLVLVELNVGSVALQDPHLSFAHGGKADFRGRDQTLWNFLSARNISMNVKTEDATFKLRKATIHGSFLTETHIVARTRANRFFNISYYASEVTAAGYGWKAANGTCSMRKTRDVLKTWKFAPHTGGFCDEIKVRMDYATMFVDSDEWTIRISPRPVYNRISGPHHRMDIELKPLIDERRMIVAPHGILGQAYDGDGLAVMGKLDVYPKDESTFTTSAMAEGALEGVADDYEMPSKFETVFKFSRFDRVTAGPRSLVGLNVQTYGKSGQTASSTDFNEPEDTTA